VISRTRRVVQRRPSGNLELLGSATNMASRKIMGDRGELLNTIFAPVMTEQLCFA
jgi:hypothetical protein